MAHSFSLPKIPIIEAIARHDPESTAIVHYPSGRTFTYGQLVHDVADATSRLRVESKKSQEQLIGERIAFLVENGYDYVVTLLSIFANHAVGVPLCTTFPNHELRYIIDNAEALMLLRSEKFKKKAEEIVAADGEYEIPLKTPIGVEKIEKSDNILQEIKLEDIPSEALDRGGMMLYTSGTTSRPKGVLLPQGVLAAQSKSLLAAWNYTSNDRLLHVLPLHHIHGTVNALLTPLYAGAAIEFMFPFTAPRVWERLAAPFTNTSSKDVHSAANAERSPSPAKPITFLTVVPTIYTRLLSTYDSLSPEMKEASRTAISPEQLRLNISGSAALATPIKQAWEELSGGNVLLERYGMTEVGMALSCGLDFQDRVDGSVGWPLPGVEVRLVETDTNEVIAPGYEIGKDGKERQGEIQLRGPSVFREYWRNPDATTKEFIDGQDGKGPWFKTGDIAVRRAVKGAGEGKSGSWAKGPLYFIQGRKSADIIKTGGEKVSALEVEREMLSLPQIAECAVVALPSDAWGQKVAAVVVLTEQGKKGGKGGKLYGPMDLRRSLKERIAIYKIPQEMRLLDAIPRNAMGKVNKRQLVKDVFGLKG